MSDGVVFSGSALATSGCELRAGFEDCEFGDAVDVAFDDAVRVDGRALVDDAVSGEGVVTGSEAAVVVVGAGTVCSTVGSGRMISGDVAVGELAAGALVIGEVAAGAIVTGEVAVLSGKFTPGRSRDGAACWAKAGVERTASTAEVAMAAASERDGLCLMAAKTSGPLNRCPAAAQNRGEQNGIKDESILAKLSKF